MTMNYVFRVNGISAGAGFLYREISMLSSNSSCSIDCELSPISGMDRGAGGTYTRVRLLAISRAPVYFARLTIHRRN